MKGAAFATFLAALAFGAAGVAGARPAAHGSVGAVSPSGLPNDSDLDGLTNDEESLHGTNPNDSDTDDGGENDGSEVDFGQDPLDPADDEIQALYCSAARPADAAVVLTFHVRPEYSSLRLYRRRARQLFYSLVDRNVAPDGEHTDDGLENGVLYYYRMMAVDGGGHRSEVTAAASATPGPHHVFSDGFECLALAWSDVVGE